MSKYTAEQVESYAASLTQAGDNQSACTLMEYAALLRQHEAAVTDEVVRVAEDAFVRADTGAFGREAQIRAALEAVAPMLASARMPDGWDDCMRKALKALERGANDTLDGRNAADEIRAMLAAAPKRGEG